MVVLCAKLLKMRQERHRSRTGDRCYRDNQDEAHDVT